MTVSVTAGTDIGSPTPAYGETVLTAGLSQSFVAPATTSLMDDTVVRSVSGYTLTVTTYSGGASNVTAQTGAFAFTPRNGDVLKLVWKTTDAISKPVLPYQLYSLENAFISYWILENGDLGRLPRQHPRVRVPHGAG